MPCAPDVCAASWPGAPRAGVGQPGDQRAQHVVGHGEQHEVGRGDRLVGRQERRRRAACVRPARATAPTPRWRRRPRARPGPARRRARCRPARRRPRRRAAARVAVCSTAVPTVGARTPASLLPAVSRRRPDRYSPNAGRPRALQTSERRPMSELQERVARSADVADLHATVADAAARAADAARRADGAVVTTAPTAAAARSGPVRTGPTGSASSPTASTCCRPDRRRRRAGGRAHRAAPRAARASRPRRPTENGWPFETAALMRILITGASAGLGAEMARQFAAGGHDLALCARRADGSTRCATRSWPRTRTATVAVRAPRRRRPRRGVRRLRASSPTSSAASTG